jgi:2-methylcitrate dehydratase PrpD
MGKHLHAGKAAQAGVISAMLAEKGFTGASSIIDGREGFMNAMVLPGACLSNNNLAYRNFTDNSKKIIDNKLYHIMGVYFKKYPVCRHLHSSIDAIAEIYNQMKLDDIKAGDITSINIKTYKIASEHDNYHPETVEAIRQSLPIAVVIYILKGNLDIHNLDVNDEIIKLASKVEIEQDNGMNHLYPSKRPSEVMVITKNRVYTSKIELPLGEPENPFNQQYLLNKFHNINPKVDLNVLKSIDKLETYRMRDLMNILNREFRENQD